MTLLWLVLFMLGIVGIGIWVQIDNWIETCKAEDRKAKKARHE